MFPIGFIISLVTGKWVWFFVIDVAPLSIILTGLIVAAFIDAGKGARRIKG